MAEVAVAIAGAVQAVAIAAAVSAVVGLVWMIFDKVWSMVPFLGSILAGALFALVFNPMDPFLGMGLGVGIAFGAYLPLKVLVASELSETVDDALSMAKSLKGVAQILCAGAALGFAHAATKSIPFALACGAAGGYVGGKYAWNPIVNFYLEFSLLGGASCSAKKPDADCVAPCTTKESKKRVDGVWSTFPCKDIDPQDTYTQGWCKTHASFVGGCAWNPGSADAGPYDPHHKAPPGTQPCSLYQPYQVPGVFSTPQVCGTAADLAAKLNKYVYNADPTKLVPVSKALFAQWYGPGNTRWGSMMNQHWDFASNGMGGTIDGQIFMTDNSSQALGDYVFNVDGYYSNEDGLIRSKEQGGTCLWDNGDGSWFTDNTNLPPQGTPVPGPTLAWRDYAAADGPAFIQSAFKGHRVCVPTFEVDKPEWNLNQQPVAEDRGSFCANKDSHKDGISLVIPAYQTKQFQCQVGKTVKPANYGLPWPW